ncbi:MAG: transposase [Oscillospiraceae bacterium]|nr:transposase [Oscillospiraceae bacterium]
MERNPDFHARRWVVEATHFFFNRFRKLLVCFEKKAANYLALVQLACAVAAQKTSPGSTWRSSSWICCHAPKRPIPPCYSGWSRVLEPSL